MTLRDASSVVVLFRMRLAGLLALARAAAWHGGRRRGEGFADNPLLSRGRGGETAADPEAAENGPAVLDDYHLLARWPLYDTGVTWRF